MKKQKVGVAILFAGAWCLGLPGSGNAQQWYGAATYQISFPLGDTKEAIDEISYRGFGLDFRKTISPGTTAGLLFGWNVFYERTHETTQLETNPPGAVTGTQDRTLNVFPIMVGVHRYLGQRGRALPYAGVSAGGYIFLQRLGIGISVIDNDRWDWGIAPEAGVVVPLERGSVLVVNGRYNYAFTGESVGGEDINHQWWGINVGFAWRQ
jgi:hypothetical protein